MRKLLIIIVGSVLLNSCSYVGDSVSAPSSYAPVSPSVGRAARSEVIERKIKRSGNLSLKSSNVKKAAAESEIQMKAHDARLDSASLTKEHYTAQIRVPSQSLEPLIDDLSKLGRVRHQKIIMKDITEGYLDLQARLKNKRALRDRLRQLLQKTSKVEEMLKIEKELARVQTELDQMEARMKLMSSQVQLSSLHFSIERKSIPGPLGIISKATGWTVKKLFTLN